MGCSCSFSRVANEDTVRRCKERRRLIKQTVRSRYGLAEAHSDYLRALRRTSAALSRFASFQSLAVSDETPPVLLQPPPPSSSTAPQPLPPPPPPLFSPPPSPPHRPGAEIRKATTLPSTASRSSVWNWEDFYPPSPPGPEFDDHPDEEEETYEDWDDRCSSTSSTSTKGHVSRSEGERYTERGEQWSTSSRSNGEDEAGRCLSRSDGEEEAGRHVSRSEVWRGGEEESAAASLVIVMRHRDLKEIVAAIEEYFGKAMSGGEVVEELLEVDRSLQRKTMDRSSSVLSALSSVRSSRTKSVRYEMDEQKGNGGRSHCSTLDWILAKEKQLYEEVKAREGVKIQYAKKLSILQSQEQEGSDELKLGKTKDAIQLMRSLILATSETVSATSSAIIKIRDDELAPQIIKLCHGFLQFWRSMSQCHEAQNHIIQQVRGLVNHSTAAESSDLHREVTRDLEHAISDWHSSFVRLLKFQRDYTHSLYSWLKLTSYKVSNEPSQEDHYSSLISSELTAFCDDWRRALYKLPDMVAAEAINSFLNIVHSISLKQKEELKMKQRVEAYSKELKRKTLALRNVERKYYRSYSTAGVGFPDGGLIDGYKQVFDTLDPLKEKKIEIAACRRRVEDEMARHARAVWATRETTLNNIQTGLPGLFQAMASFSSLFAEALEDVCCRRIGS